MKKDTNAVESTTLWVVPLLVFLFILVAAYFLHRISTSVERISVCMSKLIDGVNDVTEPTFTRLKYFLSTLYDTGAIASVTSTLL